MSSPNVVTPRQVTIVSSGVCEPFFHIVTRTLYPAPTPPDEMSRRISQSPAGIVFPDVSSTYQHAVSVGFRVNVCICPDPCVLLATLLYVQNVSDPKDVLWKKNLPSPERSNTTGSPIERVAKASAIPVVQPVTTLR